MPFLPEQPPASTCQTRVPGVPSPSLDEFRRQQVHQLFSLVPIATLASLINGGLVGFILIEVIQPSVVMGWLLGLVVMNVLWAGLVLAYRRASKPLTQPHLWLTGFVAGNLGSGLLWGMAGIAMYPPSSPSHEMFLTLVLGGMTAGSTAIHAAYFPAFLAYSLPTILPLPIQFFLQGDAPHQAVSMMGLMFIAVIIVTARRNFCMIKDTLNLETENFRLIDHLEHARSEAEALNHSLTEEITHRKEIENQLRHHKDNLESLIETRTAELKTSEARYRMVVEKISDVIWVMDLDGSRFSYISPSLEGLLGYSERDIATLSLKTFLPPTSLEKMQAVLSQALTYHQAHPHEENRSLLLVLEHRHRDGQSVWAEIRCSLLLNQANQPIGITGISRDVTERRKMEEEKHKLEGQLLRSQKLEAVGTLAGGIAHDFNNFLTTIMGNITLAKHYFRFSGENKPYLHRAEQAALRAKDLTQQLLTFSKGGEPIKQPLDLKDLLKESSELAMAGSAIACHVLPSPHLWLIEADPGQISQVIQNILINARQAMPHGGSITIRAENFHLSDYPHTSSFPLAAGSYVKVTIHDQGIGIPKEHLAKIFDPYFSTKPQGHGLGLASTYAIMKKHAGHIIVESQVGVGTTFALFFIASPNSLKAGTKPQLGICRGQGKILVMDDEDSIRIMVREMLVHCGYQVTLAHDGEETLAVYKQAMNNQAPFNLVILDLTVPGKLGGLETLTKLRQLDPRVTALVSSGYSTDPIMANYASHGFAGVIAKPYSIIDLSQMVYKLLWDSSLPPSETASSRRFGPQSSLYPSPP
ncbi:MAG: PAS domain S-box protein [Nitrospirales bacterium]|nr:PAS domain S-box protein [Nitrospirales bacterium]